MGRKARQLRPRKGADEPIIESKKRDDQKAMDGARLLQLVMAGQTAAVEAMLQRNVDPNSTDERGWPPLFHASQRGQPSMVKLLLAHKALATFAGMTGETALMVASEQGQTKIANMLLAASCSANLAAKDGTTALMGACLHSRVDMVRLLLEKKASVGASTIQGGTALAVACHGDKVLSAEIVKLLLSCRATVDALGQFAQTPLLAACQNGHAGAVEALLDHKANINHETTLGQSALSTAAMANEWDIANLLASRGALLSLASMASKAASKESKQDPFLVSGSRALIENLVAASDLNGLTGEIVGFDGAKGRHIVRLPHGEEKLIKPDNLKPLGNHSIDMSMKGYVRKLVKLMTLKLEREAVPEDFLCLIQSLDENHLQCTMQLPSVTRLKNSLILGTVVDISRHPDAESAKQEAVDGAALQAINALRRSDNVDNELSPSSSASGEEDGDPLEHELTDFKNMDMDDPEALAAFVERVNKSISKQTSALRADGEDSSSDSEPDRRAFYKKFGLESKPKLLANGNQMHTFCPSIDNLVAGGKYTHWSPGTRVITKDGKRGSIILYDATAKVYSVKLKGGKERCFKRSQLRRAPMPKEEAKKFVEAIAKWEKENRIGTFITKHMKIFRVPKEQIPSQYRKSLQGKDLIWMVHQDTRAWPDGVEFQGEAVFIDPLVAQRKAIFGEDWFNAVDTTFPTKQVPFRTLPPDVATEMFRMLDESQKEQSGTNLDSRLKVLLQEHGMVSIEYNSSVSMSEDLWKNDAEPFRLSPEEMWGVAGGTFDGFAQRFPSIALQSQDVLETEASTHFAAMDELQSQNARMHEAHQAERKKKEEALQILEETQRLHEAKEKQHQDRERSLLEQLQDAETDFAKLQTALEKEKKVALNALRAEIERLQATLQEQEAAFRKKELKLVRERQDAMESLNTSTNQEELEAVLQELTAKSAELSKQEHILAEKDFAIQSQAHELEAKQLQLSRDRADVSAKRESLLEARHQLEEQRRRVEQRFAVPAYWVSHGGSDDVSFVPVLEDRTIGALQAAILIDNLDWIGWGRDQACPAQHSGLELLWAWRVEHQGMWAKYRAEQCKMRADLKVSGIQVQPVDIKESLQAATKDLAQLDAEVNEVFLLHGTDPSKVLQIAREGLNERFSARSCFGFGSYLAEDAGKVDQYIKPEEFFRRNNELHSKLYLGSRRHPGRTFYIFVCRASLGMMARSRDGQWTLDGHSVWAQTKQRARQREFEFAPEAWPKLRYHSQVVETTPPEEMGSVPAGSTVVERYREFMTTHSERIYPEYLLAVRRAQERPIY